MRHSSVPLLSGQSLVATDRDTEQLTNDDNWAPRMRVLASFLLHFSLLGPLIPAPPSPPHLEDTSGSSSEYTHGVFWPREGEVYLTSRPPRTCGAARGSQRASSHIPLLPLKSSGQTFSAKLG